MRVGHAAAACVAALSAWPLGAAVGASGDGDAHS